MTLFYFVIFHILFINFILFNFIYGLTYNC